ncbi:MAG: N-acetyl-alpha-D-glucosaminyl L-malate synthase BshA [Chitinophagaceae bacterium]
MSLKIGMVCYPTFGGSGIVATELGKALAQKGYEIHFITYERPVRLSNFCPNIFFHEVSVLNYPLFEYVPYESALANKIVDVAQNNKLDILHVHYAVPHAMVAFLVKQILYTKNYHLPTITTLHGTDITLVGKDNSYLDTLNFALNQSDFITSVSYNLREESYKNFIIKKDIEVIYNFINNKDFDVPFNQNLYHQFAPNKEKILIHLSNFRPIKRVLDVIKIFQQTRQKIACKLLMVGDGPDRHLAEEYCRNHGFFQDVIFLGKWEDIEEVLTISDIFLLTSEYESFGLVALEAMAAGVPTVGSLVGGIPEVVIHGETGFLFPVGDVDNMAHKAIEILSNKELYYQMKSNARKHALSFDVTYILQRYENLYYKARASIL